MNSSSARPASFHRMPARSYGGRYAIPSDGDDPFEELRRANQAELHPGSRPSFFSTVDSSSILVGNADSYDALHLVNLALEEMPERGDYLMMRFELLFALRRKEEFAAALQSAWRSPILARKLDGAALRRMWRQLAPWEPVPDTVHLPDEDAAAAQADTRMRQEQFNGLAQRLAGEPLLALRQSYAALRQQPGFLRNFAGRISRLLQRPTPLQFAVKLSSDIGSCTRVYLKRDDGRNVAPHLENAAAHAYLAAAMGRKELIAGNDFDEHSLAIASMAAQFGLKCTIVLLEAELGAKPALAQKLRSLGALVRSCHGLAMQSDDPREAALRLWMERPAESHLALLAEAAPAPYPAMIADFRAILGHETELQLRSHVSADRPRAFVAARYGNADSVGLMLPQLSRGGVRVLYAEPDAATGLPLEKCGPYNGAAQLHARLRSARPDAYRGVTDAMARLAQTRLQSLEGIRIGLEDARAVASAYLIAPEGSSNWDIVVLLG